MSAQRKMNADANTPLSSNEYVWLKRVLVVDDEPDIANSYVDILCPDKDMNVVNIRSTRSVIKTPKNPNWQEFEVVVVNTAEEALKAVRAGIESQKPFALGFFDVMLAGNMDGIELVKNIQTIDPEMNAVFVTAYNDRSVDSISKLLGEVNTSKWDYINKPFSSGEILQKARNYTSLWNLRREKSLSESRLAAMQRKLLETERANSVAAISRGVTHEFGNILMQIMGKADISRKKDPEEMRKALEIILDASQRAAKILDKFKNLSNSGGYEQVREEFLMDDILDRAIDLMEFQFKDHQIKISRIKIEKVKVPMNSTSILQVILNIIINAIYAMGDTGQIDVEITKINKFAQLKIRDYGPGIRPDLLDSVKEPFFTTKGKHGSGLGLAICNEIIQIEHGGELVVHNHGIKGAEVIIRLPLEDPREVQDV